MGSNKQPTPPKPKPVAPQDGDSPTPPVERRDELEHYLKIQGFAESQINRVWEYYKIYVAGVVGLFFLGCAIAGVLGWSTFKDLKSDISTQMAQVSTQLVSRIDQQFSQTELQVMIQKKVNDVSEDYIRSNIEKVVHPRIQSLENSLSTNILRFDTKLNAVDSNVFALSKSVQSSVVGPNPTGRLNENFELGILFNLALEKNQVAAYVQLEKLSLKPNSQEIGSFFLRQIRQYYEKVLNDNKVTYPILTDNFTQKEVAIPIDEAVFYLGSPDPKSREIAAVIVKRYAHKNTAEALVNAIAKEDNLFTLSRLTDALSTVVGKDFAVLGVTDVGNWWEENKGSSIYSAPYDRLAPIMKDLKITPQSPLHIVNNLTPLIDKEPEAYASLCLRAVCFALLGDFVKAEEDLKVVEARQPDLRWYYIYGARTYLEKGDNSKVVELLAKGLEVAPASVNTLRAALPPVIVNNEKLKWR